MDDEAEGLPLAEETARQLTRNVATGQVQVRIRTRAEETRLSAELRHDTVALDRRAIGRELAADEAAPVPHEEEDGAVLVIPVLEEVLVVEKRLVLVEELRLRRRVTTTPVEQTIVLRRQHVEVVRAAADRPPPRKDNAP